MARVKAVNELLKPFQDKLFEIHGEGQHEVGFHPLHPSLRFHWDLHPYKIPVFPQAEPENKKRKLPQKGRKKTEPEENKPDAEQAPREQEQPEETALGLIKVKK